MVTKGVANVKRRTWDKAFYEKQAQERGGTSSSSSKNDDIKKARLDDATREEFQHAPSDALKPRGESGAFLKKRQGKLNLDASSGTVKIIKSNDDEDTMNIGGYYCKVCEKSYKDSVSYIDHVNSKLHQRKLGYSMRVERATVAQVRQRLRKSTPSTPNDDDVSAMEEYNAAIAEIEKETKKKPVVDQDLMALMGFEEKETNEDNDSMMALMGFGSFASSKT